MFEARISAGAKENYLQKLQVNLMQKSHLLGPTTWKVTQRTVWKDIANLRIKRLNNYTKSQRHAWMTINLKKKTTSQQENCPQFALKCLYLARTGRLDILWSVNELARAATKWTISCDKRLARLVSYIHHTSEYRQYCYVGNTAQHCRLGLFQDPDFARDLEESKSTSGGVLCIFGSHTFVPISWMCKKQTSVSHSSAEAEIISLDAGLRMGGIPALALWDLVIEIFYSALSKINNQERSYGETRCRLPSRTCTISSNSSTPTSFQVTLTTFHPMQYILVQVPWCMSLKTLRQWLRWYHRPKSHHETCFKNPQSCSGFVVSNSVILTPNTTSQTSLSKGNFTRDEWNNLLQLFNVSHFSSLRWTKSFSLIGCITMAKRIREHNEEERVVSQSRPGVMNVPSYLMSSSSSAASSPIASKSPGTSGASGRLGRKMNIAASSFDTASASQVKLKDAYLVASWRRSSRETCRMSEKKIQEKVIILNLSRGITSLFLK